ncbi:MAG TPA: hypothetical protein VIT18_02910 [Terrimicrobiaceae bacterium]
MTAYEAHAAIEFLCASLARLDLQVQSVHPKFGAGGFRNPEGFATESLTTRRRNEV